MYYSQKVMGLLGQLEKMSIEELNQVKEMVNEVKVHNAKQSIKVGSKVFVVQKTKKTPGVVTKVKVKNALVKKREDLIAKILYLHKLFIHQAKLQKCYILNFQPQKVSLVGVNVLTTTSELHVRMELLFESGGTL